MYSAAPIPMMKNRVQRDKGYAEGCISFFRYYRKMAIGNMNNRGVTEYGLSCGRELSDDLSSGGG